MIGATVVLYKPDTDITFVLLASLLAQVDVLCVIDNSPTATPLNITHEKLHYYHFPENIGIAAAQNKGLAVLQAHKCEYGLLLDQDSTVANDFVARIAALFSASKLKNQPIVAIGPRVVCAFNQQAVRPRVQKELQIYDDLVCVSQIIASGMMIDLSKLDIIGLKDERLFIDGVDHEWCWRAKTNNFMVAIADSVEMVHVLGDARSSFVGLTYKVGSPVRLYYQFRNILLLCRRSYVPAYWKTRNIVVLPMRLFVNALLQSDKRSRLKYMLCGLWDGIFNKQGPFSDHWKSKK